MGGYAKRTLKSFLLFITVLIMTVLISIGAFTTTAASDDPADSYKKIDAPQEDPSISLWFEPSFKKVFTSDTTPSGKDTYSVYMAKNETENAQFVLYSESDKTGLKASVTDFTNENGDSIPASIYYEMYVTTEKLDATSVLGSNSDTTFIREGETPDPMISLRSKTFKLNAGKSQAFFIKLKSSEDTPAGWYSATLNITKGSGANAQTLKTATVFAYVWDFAIPEKTDLQTSFYLDNNTTYGGSYKAFYDYLLENRLNAMDIPGTLNSSNAYLTNDRVNSIRVTHNGGGNVKSYMDDLPGLYSNYPAIYDDLYNSGNWDQIKDKFYFYTADEPMSKEQQYATGRTDGKTVDDVKERSERLENYWPDAQTVVPYHENHPYPYYTLHSAMANYSTAEKKDATQEMMDSHSVRVWCPQLYAFTPQSALKSIGYNGGFNATDKIRDLSGTISGMYSTSPEVVVGTGTGQYVSTYYNWADIYGQFDNRIKSYIYNENAAGENYKLWTYSAGWNKSYSYCNHLIENTGLQTKMLFWQLYQNDITGYLYYGTNNWGEYDSNNGNFADQTVTGSYTDCMWKTNRHNYATGYSIYGNGTLVYGGAQAQIMGVSGVVGTVRVEIMRDGVEEYQMFKMYEELAGNDAAKAIVSKVSNNVVDYLSMPNFTASDKSDSIDDYDYMESVRRELGNALEAATAKEACDHEWGEGTVAVEATCTVMGERHFTCAKCGAEKTEIIPTIHSTGESYTVISETKATCTTDGKKVLRCEICGNEKAVTEKAFHKDTAHYVYKEVNDANHDIYCDVCNKSIERIAHSFNTVLTNTCTEAGQKLHKCRFCGYSTVVEDGIPAKGHDLVSKRVEPTCTEDGFEGLACTRCDYTEVNVIPATGHDYVDGVCSKCGEHDPDYVFDGIGDINSDGYVNTKDSNLLKRIIAGKYEPDADERLAADLDGDGKITTKDSFALKKLILNGK